MYILQIDVVIVYKFVSWDNMITRLLAYSGVTLSNWVIFNLSVYPTTFLLFYHIISVGLSPGHQLPHYWAQYGSLWNSLSHSAKNQMPSLTEEVLMWLPKKWGNQIRLLQHKWNFLCMLYCEMLQYIAWSNQPLWKILSRQWKCNQNKQ